MLPRVRIRLHRSNLPGAKGAYYAGAANEAVLSVEDMAAALKNRGGFTGNAAAYFDKTNGYSAYAARTAG